MNHSLEKAIWHELGHFTICKLSNTKVLEFKLESEKVNWFGSVDFDDLIKNEEVLKIQNLKPFLWRILNIFSGTIFEVMYLNNEEQSNYNTFNYFKNYNSGDKEADYNKYLNYLNLFKSENNIYIKEITDNLFKDVSKIILEKSKYLEFYETIVHKIILDLNTSRTYYMDNKLIEFVGNEISISLENKSNPLNLISNLIDDYSDKITQKNN